MPASNLFCNFYIWITQLEDRSVETSIRGICIEANNTRNFSVPTNLKDSLTIRPVTKPMVSSHNDSVYSNGSVFSSASTLSNVSDLQNAIYNF